MHDPWTFYVDVDAGDMWAPRHTVAQVKPKKKRAAVPLTSAGVAPPAVQCGHAGSTLVVLRTTIVGLAVVPASSSSGLWLAADDGVRPCVQKSAHGIISATIASCPCLPARSCVHVKLACVRNPSWHVLQLSRVQSGSSSLCVCYAG